MQFGSFCWLCYHRLSHCTMLYTIWYSCARFFYLLGALIMKQIVMKLFRSKLTAEVNLNRNWIEFKVPNHDNKRVRQNTTQLNHEKFYTSSRDSLEFRTQMLHSRMLDMRPSQLGTTRLFGRVSSIISSACSWNSMLLIVFVITRSLDECNCKRDEVCLKGNCKCKKGYKKSTKGYCVPRRRKYCMACGICRSWKRLAKFSRCSNQ